MGKDRKPEFPSPPQFQPDPFLTQTQEGLFETGDALRQGQFLDPNNPVVGFLNDLVSLNPEATQRAVDLASRDVVRLRDQAQQSVINQLEANNQLTGSTTVNKLGDLNEAFSADIADIATQFYLADVERAFSNTSDLFNLGLQTLDTVGQRGLQNQAQSNEFALQRFDREVALESERFSRNLANDAAEARTVGFFTGPLGGAAYGGFTGGSQGAQAGLGGGIDGTNYFLTAASAASGFGGAPTGGGTPPIGSGSSGGDIGLNQRLMLQQRRKELGVA